MTENKKGKGCVTFIIVVAIGLALLYIFGEVKDYTGSGDPEPSEILAYNYAEQFVEQNLKSPSTAKFPGSSEKILHTTDLGGGRYKVKSWVDSQNSFGAIMRTHFSCTIVFKGDKVGCEDLSFE